MEFSPADIKQMTGMLAGAARVAVLTHTRPDGDAVGSSLAAAAFARAMNPAASVRVVYDTEIPDYLHFLTDGSGCVTAVQDRAAAEEVTADADLLFLTDLSGLDRLGSLEGAARHSKAPRILVDHHLNPKREEFDCVFSETGISSASELFYWLLKAVPQLRGGLGTLPREALTALFTGMTTDTNNFANSVFPSTLAMASELLEAGVDREFILDRLYHSYRENRVRAFASLLGSGMVIRPEGYAYMILRAAEKAGFGLRDGELEGLVNIPLSMAKVRMSILLQEDEGFFRVSIRSKRGVSANELASKAFHGGGHEQAAGGRLFFPADIGSPEDAARYIEACAPSVLGTIPAKKMEK